MSLKVALEAIERGSCLELRFGPHFIVLDPQIAGLNDAGHPVVLGVERSSQHTAPLAQWLLLRLDKAILVEISGYLSEGRRPGCDNSTRQIAQIEATAH